MSRTRLLPYLLIGPATVFLLVLFVVPLVQTIALAFTDNGTASLTNFSKMAGDLNFGLSLRNTFLLVLAVIPLQLCLALMMAMMVQKLEKGRDLVLWILIIPLGISDLAAGLVWLSILQDRGYFNTVLNMLGLIDGPVNWLSYEAPLSLFIGVVLAEVWRATAIVLVILIAGLQLIPKEYAEAAEIFGATAWTRFRKITLPLLKPSIQSALILRTVLAFEVFAVVYALSGRNFPVLVGEAYAWQHVNQNNGVAAAYAILVMGISLAATVIYIKALRIRPEMQP
ncbi:MAG TPA: sugar ABC transporter permease [Beijerinckiaceae bacterium]|nr:sugar ABC transporter permease [Beijerinckiaceae bacterium]